MLEPCFWVVQGSTEGSFFTCRVRCLDFLSLPFLDRDILYFPLEEAAEPGGSSRVGLQPAPTPMVEPTACSCNTQFGGSFWATVGLAASAGLEEEVTALVRVVTDEDSGTFSSRGGKSASIAPIMGRGSRPLIMFWRILQSHTSVRWRLYQRACLHPENSGAGYLKWSTMAHNSKLERKERNEVMIGAWMQDHDKSVREAMLTALTSVTDNSSQLRWTSLPPWKGGRHSCIAGNPVQFEVPEYHQRGGETNCK